MLVLEADVNIHDNALIHKASLGEPLRYRRLSTLEASFRLSIARA